MQILETKLWETHHPPIPILQSHIPYHYMDGINITTVNGSDSNKTGFTRKETKETLFWWRQNLNATLSRDSYGWHYCGDAYMCSCRAWRLSSCVGTGHSLQNTQREQEKKNNSIRSHPNYCTNTSLQPWEPSTVMWPYIKKWHEEYSVNSYEIHYDHNTENICELRCN